MKNRRSILVNLIIAMNLVVFWLWQSPLESRQLFMGDNFAVSWANVASGHYWTLLTSVFSHNVLWHLVINMLVLSSFGRILEQVLGRLEFIKLYIFAGLLGSLGHCAVSQFIMHDPQIAAVGASGALAGLVMAFALLFPREKLLFFFIIPVPAMIGVFVFAGLDIWGVVAQSEGGGLPIGHGAHLGGVVGGLIYYLIFLRPRILENRRRMKEQGDVI